MIKNKQELKIESDFAKSAKIVLHNGDTAEFVKTIPDNSVKLIITSPPYNVGKSYEKKQDIHKYLEWHKPIIKELVRILHPEGSICWQVGNYVDKGEIFPLDIFYYEIFKQHGLKLRNRIVWHFGHGLHARKRFSGRYETLLWFTKSDNYTFNLDPIRVPSKYPNKKYFKGDKKGEISGNPLGKNPSDFWEAIYQEWEKEIWEIPNVKSNHPCQFPVELVERCVLALTDNDDWIYDPYAGVGSALIAGIKNDRKVIGSEKEKEYVDISKKRIVSLMNGELKLRPMGKPIYDPKRTAKENSQAQLRSYANNQ